MRNGLDEIFALRGWLADQPAGFRQCLIALGRPLSARRGDPIYREGDEPGGMYGIISGGIGLQIGPPRLSPRLGHIFRAGNWFGVGPILHGGNRTMTFHATEDSRLLMVPRTAFEDWSSTDPDAMRRIALLTNSGVELAVRTASELLIPDSTRRLAAVLLRITAVDEGIVADHPDGFVISQNQLAEMANLSRSRVNAAMADLRDAGWITPGYNRIGVRDAAALSLFAYAED